MDVGEAIGLALGLALAGFALVAVFAVVRFVVRLARGTADVEAGGSAGRQLADSVRAPER